MHCWYQLIQRALSSLQVCGSAHVGHDRSQHWTTQAWFERHVLEISKGFLWFFHEFLWFSMLFYAFEVFVSHPAERGHQCVLIAMLISHRPYGIFPGLQVRQWRRGWQAVGQGCCGTSLCSIRPGNWCFWLDLFFFERKILEEVSTSAGVVSLVLMVEFCHDLFLQNTERTALIRLFVSGLVLEVQVALMRLRTWMLQTTSSCSDHPSFCRAREHAVIDVI